MNSEEKVVAIEGYDDYYISNYGNVYSSKYCKTGCKLRQLKQKGRNDPKRYSQVCLCKDNIKKYVQIHRLVAKYFVDGYFDGAVVNHKDNDIHNNYYHNLEWVTQRENIILGYKSSGIDQTRNYKWYYIIYPSGKLSVRLKSITEVKKYIEENNLYVSITSLQKYCSSKGYRLIKENK